MGGWGVGARGISVLKHVQNGELPHGEDFWTLLGDPKVPGGTLTLPTEPPKRPASRPGAGLVLGACSPPRATPLGCQVTKPDGHRSRTEWGSAWPLATCHPLGWTLNWSRPRLPPSQWLENFQGLARTLHSYATSPKNQSPRRQP